MKSKVLIIEDSAFYSDYLKRQIDAEYSVSTASTSKEGIRLASEECPDVILLDVVMPDIDGFTACSILKSNPQTCNIPVLIISSLSDISQQKRGLESGAIDFIVKPITPELLLQKIRNHAGLKHQMEVLGSMSYVDHLTGVGNRRLFSERIDAEWRRAVRNNSYIGIAIFDIDFFKQYNDTYGHLCGDECLKSVSSVLKDCLKRGGDTVVRYGGEEFVCIMPGIQPESVEGIVDKIRLKIYELNIPHKASSVADRVTVSAGAVVAKPGSCSGYEDVMSAADDALYEAKNAGRNRISVAR